MEIKFVKTHEEAKLPEKNNSDYITGDAGHDLFAIEDAFIPPRGSMVVPIGLTLAFVTPGYWFRIEPRSGLGFKKSLQPHLGIIDNGYRGDLGVKLYNFSDEVQFVKKGSAIAQFVVYQMIPTMVSFTEFINPSSRGALGFGSSDKK